MALTFYTNPMSRGQIARWALHEAGADYDEVLLDYGTTMKAPEYLEINPMGKVPCIVHDGFVVTEAAAICLYLADAFPDAGLAFRTPQERADGLRWTFFAAGPIEHAITVRSMGWDKDGFGPETQGRLGFGKYETATEALAGWMDGRDYVCGNRFTAADLYVGAQVDWGMQFKTLPDAASFRAYAERLRDRPAYKSAKARDAELIAAAQSE